MKGITLAQPEDEFIVNNPKRLERFSADHKSKETIAATPCFKTLASLMVPTETLKMPSVDSSTLKRDYEPQLMAFNNCACKMR